METRGSLRAFKDSTGEAIRKARVRPPDHARPVFFADNARHSITHIRLHTETQPT
jgi:hypothetical protein